MGSHRAKALTLACLAGLAPVGAMEPGWQYSPLPGEGDRASMGCARGSTDADYACLVVRCEDDFSTGLHLYTSRADGAAGRWEMTLDREARHLDTTDQAGPYGARLADPDGWLLDGLRHGTFVYLKHVDDAEGAFAYIDLAGSFRSISEALYWCAAKAPADEQSAGPDVVETTDNGETK